VNSLVPLIDFPAPAGFPTWIFRTIGAGMRGKPLPLVFMPYKIVLKSSQSFPA
jgi:hypothetical protein